VYAIATDDHRPHATIGNLPFGRIGEGRRKIGHSRADDADQHTFILFGDEIAISPVAKRSRGDCNGRGKGAIVRIDNYNGVEDSRYIELLLNCAGNCYAVTQLERIERGKGYRIFYDPDTAQRCAPVLHVP